MITSVSAVQYKQASMGTFTESGSDWHRQAGIPGTAERCQRFQCVRGPFSGKFPPQPLPVRPLLCGYEYRTVTRWSRAVSVKCCPAASLWKKTQFLHNSRHFQHCYLGKSKRKRLMTCQEMHVGLFVAGTGFLLLYEPCKSLLFRSRD